jgi:hypothetical protein
VPIYRHVTNAIGSFLKIDGIDPMLAFAQEEAESSCVHKTGFQIIGSSHRDPGP